MSDIKRLPTPLQIDDDLNIPLGERKTVDTLMAGDCRWPFGDPLQGDFHFCGKQKVDGSPYCAFHVRRAFQAAKPRVAFYRPHAA